MRYSKFSFNIFILLPVRMKIEKKIFIFIFSFFKFKEIYLVIY